MAWIGKARVQPELPVLFLKSFLESPTAEGWALEGRPLYGKAFAGASRTPGRVRVAGFVELPPLWQ